MTAVSAGTTSITATAAGVSGSATVTVTPIVRAISVTPGEYNVNVGAIVRIAPTVSADVGASQLLVWTSSATSVATVDQSGDVVGVTPGVATITIASQAFPGIIATATVQVSFPVVRSVVVTPALPSILQGATRPMTATVDADPGTPTSVNWTSTATNVATISNSGLVTAVAPGTTTIRATSTANPTVNGSTVLTVTAPTVRSVALSPTIASLVVSGTRQFLATIDADVGANTALTWTSSDNAIAQVSATGLVTALTPGAVTIRATSTLVPTVFGIASITVTTPPPLTTWVAQQSVPPSTLDNAFQYFGYSLSDGTAWTSTPLGQGNRSMLLWNGLTWNVVNAAPFDQTNAMGGFEDNVWLGSNSGRLARLDRGGSAAPTWVEMSSPVSSQIFRIIGTSATTAVAATSTQIMTLSSGVWSLITPPGISMIDVAASAGNNIVVASRTPVNGSRIRRWNGSGWTMIPDPSNTGDLSEIELFGSSIIVLDEELNSAIYNGVMWNPLTVPPARTGTNSENFSRLQACGGQLYAVTSTGGRVFKLVGSSWTTIGDYSVAIPGSRNLRSMCGGDNVLRVLGTGGSVSRYTGTTWIPEVSSVPITRVVIVRPDLAWAIAFGQIRKWDGVRWTIDKSDPTYLGESSLLRPNGLGAAPDGTVMATSTTYDQPAGVFRRTPNGTWHFDAMTVRCNDVWTASSTFALAVGGGCGLQWNGSTWLTVGGLPSLPNSVHGVSPSDALAVGAIGTASASSHWNGITWTSVTTPNVGVLRSVRMASPTLAYALGDNGMLRWDGTQWNAVSISGALLAAFPLRDISVNSANEVYALTKSATVYRFHGTGWELVTTVTGAVGDVVAYGATALATIPGYGIIGSAAGFAFHSNTLTGLLAK